MKIDWKSKNTKITAGILAVILVPIIFNQAKTAITGAFTAYMMSQPKTVEVAKPMAKEINPTYSTTGRIEAQKTVDIIARVSGWLQERYFQEGDTVKKGQKLFLIEQQYLLKNEHDTSKKRYKNCLPLNLNFLNFYNKKPI